MNKIEVCPRSEITDADWLDYWWSEITSLEDSEPVYLKGVARTPAEIVEARAGWVPPIELGRDRGSVGGVSALAIALALTALVVSVTALAVALRVHVF